MSGPAGVGATITGLPELKAALRGVAPKLRVRALRNALAGGARVVQRAARAATPIISLSAPAVLKGYRKPGTVRKAISVRTSKLARRSGDVGVFVNVRPAKAGNRGARNPNDPFYWRWLNFGWHAAASLRGGRRGNLTRGNRGGRFRQGFRFLEAGARMLPQALEEFYKRIGPAIERLNRPKAPPP